MKSVMVYVKSYESHIGKTLIDHTLGVLERAVALWDSVIVRLESLWHDVGKLNINFGYRLHGKNTDGLYCNHAYLSFYVMLSYYINHKGKRTMSDRDLIILSICILKHHGSLPNLEELFNVKEFTDLKNFLNTNPYLPVAEFLSCIGFEVDPKFKLSDITVEEASAMFKLSWAKAKIENFIDFYLDLRMCFSALVSADKYDAGKHKDKEDIEIYHEFNSIYKEKMESYVNSLGGNLVQQCIELNHVRTQIRNRCIGQLKDAMDRGPNKRLFCLTEPTGAGKTAILLSLARVIMTRANIFKIIYAIPYLSITEQIYGIIEKIFGKDSDYIKRLDCKATPEFDGSYLEGTEEDSMMSKFKSVIRKCLKGKTIKDEKIHEILNEDYKESTFDYPLIVTTFVQLFQSFTTATNKGLMRFSSLRNSIILIDEIQTLPPRLYTFFVAMLDIFCRKYDCYAVISTATMPCFEISSSSSDARGLFRDYLKPVEIGNFDDFSNPIFNRYNFHTIRGATGMSITLDGISDKIGNEQLATLAIFNTVRDSKMVYKILKRRNECPVFLLNSNFYSFDRRKILNKCRDLLEKNEKFYLITTQLIEAGVDIDFPIVYRDIAPLPSLIQGAGRCNRNARQGYMGKVYIFCLNSMHLAKPHGGLRARCIYKGADSMFLEYSIETFFLHTTQSIFPENSLFSIQANYFNNLSEQLEFGKWSGGNFVDQINNLMFHDIGRYTVIAKDAYGNQVAFYVPVDENDKAYETLVEMWSDLEDFENGKSKSKDRLRDILSKRRMMHLHFRDMMDRVIQVHLDEYEIPEYAEYDGRVFDMYKLKPGRYDPEYGFKGGDDV